MRSRRSQAGFSMVEMLVAAFIMSVGLMGLTVLMTMSLRTITGSKSLSTAVQIAEQIMDQVELEGRLTYLNMGPTEYTDPGALTGIQYLNQVAIDQYFNVDPTTGNVISTAAPASGEAEPMFHANMSQAAATAGIGVSDVTVTVQFIDGINQVTNQPVRRTVTITRRILHG
jgi:prepilin-type N-terminal cleavage/methylation domain-containing protein